MPSLHHAFTIDYSGKVLELRPLVQVASPTLTGTFDSNKKFETFTRAIWDTGATGTVITKKVIDALNLVPTGITIVNGVGGQHQAKTYVVDILLPNKVLVPNVNVLEGSGESFDVLIGMDIIQTGDMAISNANGKTKFSFCFPPHDNPICLVEKSNKVNERLKKIIKRISRG